MECKNISRCKFLKTYPDEYDYWYEKYCNDTIKAQACKRAEWCKCRGSIPSNLAPDGTKR